jgi:hypothetical protein
LGVALKRIPIAAATRQVDVNSITVTEIHQ